MGRNLFWLGYILGSAMFIAGVLVMTGILDIQQGAMAATPMLRTVFGLVLMLYGIYRISITEMQRRREERSR